MASKSISVNKFRAIWSNDVVSSVIATIDSIGSMAVPDSVTCRMMEVSVTDICTVGAPGGTGREREHGITTKSIRSTVIFAHTVYTMSHRLVAQKYNVTDVITCILLCL